jgi:hypothetical protein
VTPPKTPPPIAEAGESEPEVDTPTVIPPFDPSSLARESEPDEDRPTVIPEFDPEAFARDSELRQRQALPVTGGGSAGGSTVDEARRLLQAGDPEQALFLLARLLELAPFHSEASALSAECRAALERECLSAIGSLSTVFVVALAPEELKGFGLDNVSGFLISLMDGATDVETMLDLSGLPRLLALRHLRGLLARGVVEIAKRPT